MAKWILGIVLVVAGLGVCGITVLGEMMSDSGEMQNDTKPLLVGAGLIATGIAAIVFL